MKVMQINSVCGIRSTGKICTDLEEVLRRKGHESRILYGRETAPEIYDSISRRITSPNEIRVHAFLSRIFDNSGFCSKKSTHRMIDEIERYNPDIVHLHNIHGYYLDVDSLFKYLKQSKRNVVWTLHDCWAMTGHCSHFTMAQCEQWKTHCSHCIQKKEYPACYGISNANKNFERKKKAFRNVSNMTIVTPSQWLADITKQSFLKDYPIKLIPNGVDLSVFKPDSQNPYSDTACDGKRVLLSVATAWTDRKGYHDYIRLSKILDDRYQIVLIGLTNKQLKILPKDIVGVKVKNSREELARYYSNAYAVLSLSKEETMGLTVVEALACGTPVVVYNSTALPEIVTVKCGRIVECGNLNGIVKVLDELEEIDLKDCVKRAEEYEKQKMYEEYISLYEEHIK